MRMREHLRILLLVFCAILTSGCDLFVSSEERVARAQSLMAQHDYRAAMIELKSALQADEDHAQARLLLARVSLHLGDAASAEKELSKAVAAGASVEETAQLDADVRLALGRAEEVATMIQTGESALHEPARSTYLGRAFLELRQPEDAMAAFRTALEAAPDDEAARLGLAKALIESGQIAQGLEALDRLASGENASVQALLTRGVVLLRRGEIQAAEADLQAARRLAPQLRLPEQAGLLAALTEARLAHGDATSARETQSALARLAPEAPLTRVLAARIAMAEQNYRAAASELQKVVAQAPEFVHARFLLGAVLLAEGQLHQAEAHLTQALQRAPENLEARKLLAQVQLRLERPDEAMQVLSPALQSDGRDAQVEALLGLAHLQSGDQRKGLEFLERSVADNPANRDLKIELGAAYLRAGRAADALSLMRRLSSVPDDARREYVLLAAMAQQDAAAARAAADQMANEFAEHPGVLNVVSAFYASQGEIERARVLLSQALQVAPDDLATLINRARIEVAAGNLEEAGAWLDRALESDPSSSMARMLRADLALRLGRTPKALEVLEELRARDSQALEPRLALARLYFRERRTQDGAGVLKEVLSIAGANAQAHNAVGLIELEAGRYEEALARFSSARTLEKDNPTHLLHMARAQLALGHRSAARESLQNALQVRRGWIPAISALTMLDLSEGKSAAAFARLAEAKEQAPRDPAVAMLEGDLYLSLKKYAEAAKAFAAAAALQPSAAAALKEYKARQAGRLGDAAAPLEAWLKRQPDDFTVRAVLAEAYQGAGQRTRAIEQYELVVRNEPRNVFALNNLAWLYHETGDDDRAETLARKAYQAAPKVAAVADTYGWILVRSGKIDEGIPILEQAVSAAPSQPDIAYHYAAALAAAGEQGKARVRLEELLARSESFATRAEAERLLESLPRS